MHWRERSQQARVVRQHFKSKPARRDIKGEWTVRVLDEDFSGSGPRRCANLLVTGQVNPDNPETFVSEHFAESLPSATLTILLSH